MSVKIKIQEANLIESKSDSKRPSINANIGQYLLDAVKGNNDSLSKSMVTYEVLLYAKVIPFDDSITHLEKNINTQLENNGIDVNDINNYNIKDIDIYDKYDYDIDESERMQITFPKPVFESVDWERKWGSHIEEAVEYYLLRQFESRHHRIDVKMDILSLITSSKNKSDVSELAGEIYESLTDNNKFELDNPNQFTDKAKLCESVDDKKKLIKSLSEFSLARKTVVNQFITVFDYSDEYRAHKIANETFEEYNLYEYGNFNLIDDEEFIGDELEHIKSHPDKPLVLLKLLENHALEFKDVNYAYVPNFIDVAKDSKLIKKDEGEKELMNILKDTADNYDISVNSSSLNPGKLYFE